MEDFVPYPTDPEQGIFGIIVAPFYFHRLRSRTLLHFAGKCEVLDGIVGFVLLQRGVGIHLD